MLLMADAEYMIPGLVPFISLGVLIAGVHYCGKKFLLVVPSTIIPMPIGLVTNMLLWDAASGRYEDSDTLIFGAPRIPGSTDGWFEPAQTALGLALFALGAAVVTFAVWPKDRPAAPAGDRG